MKYSVIYLIFIMLLLGCGGNAHVKQIPLEDGEYTFKHRYAEAEQHRIESITLTIKIYGKHIIVINNDRDDVFPIGILEEGTLMWHSKSSHWIIGHNPSDANAPEVGGCSEGPTVIDFEKRIYWTC